MGTPEGESQSSAIEGHCPAGTVNRAFGCAAGPVPSHCSPRQSMRSGGGAAVKPSHQTSPSAVSAVFVKMAFSCSVAMAFALVRGLVPGATPKNPEFRIDRPKRSVFGQPHPGNIVADRFGFSSRAKSAPAWRDWSCRRRSEMPRQCIGPGRLATSASKSACARRASLRRAPSPTRYAKRDTSSPKARCRHSLTHTTRFPGFRENARSISRPSTARARLPGLR